MKILAQPSATNLSVSNTLYAVETPRTLITDQVVVPRKRPQEITQGAHSTHTNARTLTHGHNATQY